MEELDKLPKQKHSKLPVRTNEIDKKNKKDKIVEKQYLDELLDDKFLSGYFDKISIKNKIDIK